MSLREATTADAGVILERRVPSLDRCWTLFRIDTTVKLGRPRITRACHKNTAITPKRHSNSLQAQPFCSRKGGLKRACAIHSKYEVGLMIFALFSSQERVLGSPGKISGPD